METDRYRKKKREKVGEEITVEQWKEYFMNLLGEIDRRVMRGGGERNERYKREW